MLNHFSWVAQGNIQSCLALFKQAETVDLVYYPEMGWTCEGICPMNKRPDVPTHPQLLSTLVGGG